jgi:transposase
MSTTTRQAAAKPIKVGTWRRDFAGLQARRLEAARLFAHGATQAEVARTFGVSPQAASSWYRRWRQGGAAALRGAGRAGRRPRLSQAELAAVDQPCARGQRRSGSTPTCGRWRVWRLLRRLGWSLQRPARRAAERDEAAIARWRAQEWPRINGGR